MPSLHWEGHDNAIISEVARFYRDGVNVDCSFLIDGQFLKGHKVILCACSPYFQELFKWRSGKNPIPLKNVSYKDMKYIMSYMYNGVVDVPLNELESFINVSKSFQIKGLEKLYSPKKLDITSKCKTSNNREEPLTNKENTLKYQESRKSNDFPAQKTNADCQTLNNCENEISFIGSSSGGSSGMYNEFQNATNEYVNRVKIKQEGQEVGNTRSWAPPSKHFASEQHGSSDNEQFWRFLEEIGLQTKASSNGDIQNDKSATSVGSVAVERERYLRERHILPMQYLQVNIGESSNVPGSLINGHRLKEARVVLERIDVSKLGTAPQFIHKNNSASKEKGAKRMKSTKERYPCIYCFASYTNRNVLQEHLITHTGENQFLCQDCYFAFPTRLDLVNHREKHMEEERRLKGIPDAPPATFERNRYPSLPEEKIEGDGDDPDGRRFRCQFCSTEFAHRGHLRVHLRTHTGEKPFQCRYCTMAFARKWNLKCHIRSHLGEKAYTCQNCPAAFAKRESLVKHRIVCPEQKANVSSASNEQKVNVMSSCDEQKVNELSVNNEQGSHLQSSFNEHKVDVLSSCNKEKPNISSQMCEQATATMTSSCNVQQNNVLPLCESQNPNAMPCYGQQKTNILPLCDGQNANVMPLYEGLKANVLSLGEGQKSRILPMHEVQSDNALPLYEGPKANAIPLCGAQNGSTLSLYEGQKSNDLSVGEGQNAIMLPLYGGQKGSILPLCEGQNTNMLPMYEGQKNNVLLLCEGQSGNMLPLCDAQNVSM